MPKNEKRDCIVCGWWTTTGGSSGVYVKINPDGTVALNTGAVEIGTAALTGAAQVLAEELGGRSRRTSTWSSADTFSTPFDYGAQGSRTAFAVGNACRAAAADLKRADVRAGGGAARRATEDALRAARTSTWSAGRQARVARRPRAPVAADRRRPDRARHLHRAADRLRHQARGGPRLSGLPLAELPRARRRSLRRRGDRRDHHPQVRRRAGRRLRHEPDVHRGADRGRRGAGAGAGAVGGDRLRDGPRAEREPHRLQDADDARRAAASSRSSSSTRAWSGPYGAKGVGEPPNIEPPATVANAIAAATGVRSRSLPITAEKIAHGAAGGRDADAADAPGCSCSPRIPSARLAAIAVLAERAGYDDFWLADERFFREVYACLTALRAAHAADPARPVRHRSVLAPSRAHRDGDRHARRDLARQRAVLGIGAGVSGFRELGIDAREVRRRPPRGGRADPPAARRRDGDARRAAGQLRPTAASTSRRRARTCRSTSPRSARRAAASAGPRGRRRHHAGLRRRAARRASCATPCHGRRARRAATRPRSTSWRASTCACTTTARAARDVMKPTIVRSLSAQRPGLLHVRDGGPHRCRPRSRSTCEALTYTYDPAPLPGALAADVPDAFVDACTLDGTARRGRRGRRPPRPAAASRRSMHLPVSRRTGASRRPIERFQARGHAARATRARL